MSPRAASVRRFEALLLLLPALCSAPLHSQEPTPSIPRGDVGVAPSSTLELAWEEILEDITEEDSDYDWQEEIEELDHLREHPIDLNTATRHDLEQLPMLSPQMVEHILAYIYLNGPMQTVHELQLVYDMDRRTLQLILPFVTVRPIEERKRFPRLRNILHYGRHEVLTRLDLPLYTRQGYTDGSYLGTKQYHSLRYAFSYGDYLQAGLTAEKDAGEPLFGLHNSKGYDFYSPYFVIRTPGALRTLALGNYRASFGLGLVMCSDLRLGKSYSLSTSEYRSTGLRKHSSTGEYTYFQGAGLTLALSRRLDLSAFYSYRKMDGATSDSTITSILKTGLHRTELEVSKIHTFSLQVAGGNITYDSPLLRLGLTGIYYAFSRPYEPSRSSTYMRYNLHGQQFYNIGFDYCLRLGRLNLTGEGATGSKGFAVINRLRYQPSTNYQFLLIHRYYAHNYWAFFGRSFGEGSTPQNENGWYLALSAAPLRHWRLFASVDAFSFPWWRYRISKASQGIDLMLKAEYTPRSNISMYLTYRYKRKERDVTGTSGAYISPILHHKLRYRLNMTYGLLSLRTTLDYNHFRQQDISTYIFSRRQGWQATQMLVYGTSTRPLSGSLQFTYFHTNDYDSRVYVSERGLMGSFYSPSYYGQGFRLSATLRLNLGQTFTLLAKFGQTTYRDRDSISSGDDLIPSNKKADVQLQVRLKF